MRNTTAVILSEPRSGSTWLTSIFVSHGFGALGSGGSWEIFDSYYHPFPAAVDRKGSIEYVQAKVDSCRKNGNAVVKVMYNQIREFAQLIGLPCTEIPVLLTEFFPGAKFLRLKRLDYIAQVVSLYVARKTDIYRSTDSQDLEGKQIRYLFSDILSIWMTLRKEARAVFDHCEDLFNPFLLTYEDMVKRKDVCSSALSNFIGAPIDVGISTPIKKQQSKTKHFCRRLFSSDLHQWKKLKSGNGNSVLAGKY